MRSAARPVRTGEDPIPLHSRALDDLSFIRDTMARAGTVTSVPGWGGVAMGVTALAASWIASRQGTGAEWLAVWLAEGGLALAIGGRGVLDPRGAASRSQLHGARRGGLPRSAGVGQPAHGRGLRRPADRVRAPDREAARWVSAPRRGPRALSRRPARSEEHTSELQSRLP